MAEQSQAASDHPVAGVTPFIAFTTIRGKLLDKVTSVTFTIPPQPGTVSKPVSVSYSPAYLARHGDAPAGGTSLTVPVFGLYAGVTNYVQITLKFSDNSSLLLPVGITPAPFDHLYTHPTVIQARAAGTSLGFDFFYIKSILGSPAIIDTDGNLRWLAAPMTGTPAVDFVDGGFIMGAQNAPTFKRVEMDGTVGDTTPLQSTEVLDFHHDIEPGKTALLNNVDTIIDGVFQSESVLQEFTTDGQVLAQWDMGQILSDYMLANGDDPTLFVRPGIDWFHSNTAIYDSRDDTLIVSSRENFVMKIGYTTGDIRWIFGDPTKYWYSFPSLRAKSLTLLGDGLVPIGQHSITIAPDGNLMLFNNGFASINMPFGQPAGASRPYAAVSSYTLDTTSMTATEAWHFDYNKSLTSIICSSARATGDGSILVDFATADSISTARLVGLDPNHQVVFHYEYPTTFCNTAWNAQPIALEAMQLD